MVRVLLDKLLMMMNEEYQIKSGKKASQVKLDHRKGDTYQEN
jgi:hypothetical protein